MSMADKLVTIAENEQKVYDAGKQAEQFDIWDAYQNNGNACTYAYRLQSVAIGAENWERFYKPKHDYIHRGAQSTISTFRECPITDVIKDNYCNDGTAFTMAYTFYYAQQLVNARTWHVGKNVEYVQVFDGCLNLQEIRFEGTIGKNGLSFSACTKLSKASIESTINTLSASTSGLKVTFSKTAVNKAFETSKDANDGSTSTEWITLVASKSNWTISLV